MRNPAFLVLALILPLFTGCKEIGSLQFAQDRPEDIQQLLEHDEYSRARQLTKDYPAIDTPELQALISTQEVAYADNIYAWARSLESENDLAGAVQLLSNALQKVPNNNILRGYRNRLKKEHLEGIRANEKDQLIARAEYILNQKMHHQQKNNQQQPNLVQRWERTRSDWEFKSVAKQLLSHGKYAFKQNDLEGALECVQLSKKLYNAPEARDLLDKLTDINDSQQDSVQKQTSLYKLKKQNEHEQRQAKKTRKLLDAAQDALSANDLVVARANFIQIPSPSSQSREVAALQKDLELAVSTRVAQLTLKGDAEYRADFVVSAIRIWGEALELDPENRDLKERIDRATRVLAKLEQLKQQQGK